MSSPATTPVLDKSTADGQEEKKIYKIEYAVPNGGKVYLFAKRSFDLAVSLIAAVILIIPMAIIALFIACDSKGPVLYKQERYGKNKKVFTIYKFRTMRVDAEANGPKWADQEDSRCTKVGKFLRKCRFDEFPQLINIIRGDMSFVGPRPERPCFYEEFETYIHGFENRLAVTPGLTGLAQINGGYNLKPEEKIIYDMEYIKTRSFWLDIKLMFSTVKFVFNHDGAR